MVGIIPLNLRSQETNKGVQHAHARAATAVGRAGLGPGVAWHGVARRGEAGRQAGGERAWCGYVNF
jgi:hypothetical protein